MHVSIHSEIGNKAKKKKVYELLNCACLIATKQLPVKSSLIWFVNVILWLMQNSSKTLLKKITKQFISLVLYLTMLQIATNYRFKRKEKGKNASFINLPSLVYDINNNKCCKLIQFRVKLTAYVMTQCSTRLAILTSNNKLE